MQGECQKCPPIRPAFAAGGMLCHPGHNRSVRPNVLSPAIAHPPLSPAELTALTELSTRPYTPAASLAATTDLRKRGLPPATVATLLTQWRLRTAAAAKLGDISTFFLLSDDGAQQATRPAIAAEHARLLADTGICLIVDIGCGIGADAHAFQSAGMAVIAIDADPDTAALAAHNLRADTCADDFAEHFHAHRTHRANHCPASESPPATAPAPALVLCARLIDTGGAPALEIPGESGPDGVREILSLPDLITAAVGPATPPWGVWLDPARRAGGRRINDPARWSPSLPLALAAARGGQAGAIKVSPAIAYEHLPADSHVRFSACDREVLEAAIYLGTALPAGRCAVIHTSSHDAASDQSASPIEFSYVGEPANPPAELEVANGVGHIIFEPHKAVLRAGLIDQIARELNAAPLARGIGYLTADLPDPTLLPHLPGVEAFAVQAILPTQPKKLRKELAARAIGSVEIKKRGCSIDPQRMRTALKLPASGKGQATVIFTPVGPRPDGRNNPVHCLLVERL